MVMIFQTIDQKERKRKARIKILMVAAFIIVGIVSWILVKGVRTNNMPIRDFHFKYAHSELR